ncbi:MAG: helix-turn-helix transcriptional regulator [Leptolyngbyaceae cyanobacterium RU_5_1]|nr:helix-turn-helix transcriptional regulator [Leptolyngbyaceae cyanobacterium RU_5_1]
MNSSNRPPNFLQAVLESFVDGILVLTEQKELLYANATAQQLCQRLAGSSNAVPREVWQVCEALIESRELYPNQLLVIESEIEHEEINLRIRAQWLTFETVKRPCLLVRLQDQNQAIQGLAIAEAQTWGLTDREAQVWMLRRSGWSRKQIAGELFIALDTVKKHLRNIQMKRQTHVDEEDWQLNQKSLCTA